VKPYLICLIWGFIWSICKYLEYLQIQILCDVSYRKIKLSVEFQLTLLLYRLFLLAEVVNYVYLIISKTCVCLP
jgi:hypothetical protein